MNLQFNPIKIADFLKSGMFNEIDDADIRGFQFFVDIITELQENGRDISVKDGCLHCPDVYEGHEIIWVVNVRQTIIHTLSGNSHLSLDVIHQPKDRPLQSTSICVRMPKNLPLGDYLASFVLLYNSGEAIGRIQTMEPAARKVCGLMDSNFESSHATLMATWRAFRENLIEQAENNSNRLDVFMELEFESRIFIARQLMEMDDDLDYFNSDDLHALVSLLFEHCGCHDTLRVVISRAGATGDWKYIDSLQRLVRSKPEDPRVSRAAIYAICRLQSSINPHRLGGH